MEAANEGDHWVCSNRRWKKSEGSVDFLQVRRIRNQGDRFILEERAQVVGFVRSDRMNRPQRTKCGMSHQPPIQPFFHKMQSASVRPMVGLKLAMRGKDGRYLFLTPDPRSVPL